MKMFRVWALFAIGCAMTGCDYTAVMDPPITITMRNGILSHRVLQVSNLSTEQGVEVYMYVADTNHSVRSGNIVIPANGMKEFGALEIDWEFKTGDRGFVRSPRHTRKLCFELENDGQYRTWFGFDDIPEVDVAEQVRIRKVAEHASWLKAAAAAECQRGRQLFLAIDRVNAEREAAGLEGVWPKPAQTQGGIREFVKEAGSVAARFVKDRCGVRTPVVEATPDIAAMKFKTSERYFERLWGVGKFASPGCHPYVTGINMDSVVCGGQTNGTISAETVRWSVLADYSGELNDALPVLVSANFPCEKLRAFWDGKENAKEIIPLLSVGETKDESFVVVYRNGHAKSFLAKDATLENIYPGAFNTCTNGYNRQIQYLTPHGVVNAAGIVK